MLRGQRESKWLSALQSAGEENTLKKMLVYSGPGLVVFYFSQLEYVIIESVLLAYCIASMSFLFLLHLQLGCGKR